MQGDPVEFEFISADAQTAGEIFLHEPGNSDARALGSDERLIIQHAAFYFLGSGPTSFADLFTDEDQAGALSEGELILRTGTSQTTTFDFTGTGGGVACSRGILPKVIANTVGIIGLTGVGVIINS